MPRASNPYLGFFLYAALVLALSGLLLLDIPLEADLAGNPQAQLRYMLYASLPLVGSAVLISLSLAAYLRPLRFEPLLARLQLPRARQFLAWSGFAALVLVWGCLVYFSHNGQHRFLTSRGIFMAGALTLLLAGWLAFSRQLAHPAAGQEVPASRLLRFLASLSPILVLALQNLASFWQHYFANIGFPWDFPLAYYGFVVFWTSAASVGLHPEWMPFQQMGYPMALNLQSGRDYLPFWLFPTLHIPYTLNAAVVFQCLHVLVGAIGAYIFFKQLFGRRSLALVGAFAFQFFGGFYSNAQHPDIIRAFAFLPWLFYSLTLDDWSAVKTHSNHPIRFRHWLAPLLVWFMATGGYPGNFIASLFFIALYVVLQLADRAWQQRAVLPAVRTGLWVGGLVLLGLLLALPHLAPPFSLRSSLMRFQTFEQMSWWGLQWNDLYALYLPTEEGDSLTSTYLTFPLLALAFLAPLKALRRYWVFISLAFYAALMAGGEGSWVWQATTSLLSPLRFSRFPVSDYRATAVLLGIVIGLGGLASLTRAGPSPKRMALGFLWLGLFCTFTLLAAGPTARLLPLIHVLLLFLASLLLLACLPLLSASPWSRYLALLLLLLVMAWDASRVLWTMSRPWQAPDYARFYQNRAWPLMQDGQLITPAILARPPATRPARLLNTRIDYSWRGYITGDYMLYDLQRSYLAAPDLVYASPPSTGYMQLPWTPLLFAVPPGFSPAGWSVPEEALAAAAAQGYAEPRIRQLSYGMDTITYAVDLPHASIFVENEVYFPGWTASLDFTDRSETVTAFAASQVFRAWLLPGGEYTMTATFAFPQMQLYRKVQLLALLAWGTGGAFFVLKRLRQPA